MPWKFVVRAKAVDRAKHTGELVTKDEVTIDFDIPKAIVDKVTPGGRAESRGPGPVDVQAAAAEATPPAVLPPTVKPEPVAPVKLPESSGVKPPTGPIPVPSMPIAPVPNGPVIRPCRRPPR